MGQSDLDSDSNSDLEIEMDFEVKYPEIPIEVSNFINELCSEFKYALERIFKLKKENSLLRQHDVSQKDKIYYKDNFMKSKKIMIYLLKKTLC